MALINQEKPGEKAYKAVAEAFAATHPDTAAERAQAVALLGEALQQKGVTLELLVNKARQARKNQEGFRSKLGTLILSRYWEQQQGGNVIRARGFVPPGPRPDLQDTDVSP